MPKIITEDMIEQAAIKALQERHNYTVLNLNFPHQKWACTLKTQ